MNKLLHALGLIAASWVGALLAHALLDTTWISSVIGGLVGTAFSCLWMSKQ